MRRSVHHGRLLVFAFLLASATPAQAVDWSVSGFTGFKQGLALRLAGSADNLFRNIPAGVSLGVGYAFLDPGDALAARRVFINDNTDGTPNKDGHVWDLRLDVFYHFKLGWLDEVTVFIGPRYSMFSGHFYYVGGNEDFVISANDWGFGWGLSGTKALSPRWSLTLTLGIDWFPASSLYGHSRTYSSDGTNVDGRAGYTWANADDAVNQPRLTPGILVGIVWKP